MSIRIDAATLVPPQGRPEADDIQAKARTLVRPATPDTVGIGPQAKARSQAPAPVGEMDEQAAQQALEQVASSVNGPESAFGHSLDPERVAQLVKGL